MEHSWTYSLYARGFVHYSGYCQGSFDFILYFVNVAGLPSTNTQSFVDAQVPGPTSPLQRRAPHSLISLIYMLPVACCLFITNLDIEVDKRSCLHCSNSQRLFWWFMDFETVYTRTPCSLNSARTCTQLYFLLTVDISAYMCTCITRI